jgi:ABC-type sulfate transport system permease component
MMNEYRLTLIFLQLITMVLAYVLVWRKRKQSSFKEIIKTPEMMKALAISYGVVFGSFVLVIIVMRQMK